MGTPPPQLSQPTSRSPQLRSCPQLSLILSFPLGLTEAQGRQASRLLRSRQAQGEERSANPFIRSYLSLVRSRYAVPSQRCGFLTLLSFSIIAISPLGNLPLVSLHVIFSSLILQFLLPLPPPQSSQSARATLIVAPPPTHSFASGFPRSPCRIYSSLRTFPPPIPIRGTDGDPPLPSPSPAAAAGLLGRDASVQGTVRRADRQATIKLAREKKRTELLDKRRRPAPPHVVGLLPLSSVCLLPSSPPRPMLCLLLPIALQVEHDLPLLCRFPTPVM